MDWSSGAFGLAGVVLGGYLVSRHQRIERRQSRIREQLAELYSPLLGRRERLRARGEVRVKVSHAASAAWKKLCADVRADDPSGQAEALRKMREERFPKFQELIEDQNGQLREELPIYREMLQLFESNLGLAEHSTRRHFGTMVGFVELWNRYLDERLPGEVVKELDKRDEINEAALIPLYEELERQVDRLQQDLREERGWWCWLYEHR